MSNHKIKYRREIKYLLSYAEYLLLSSRCLAVLNPDRHSGKEGYFIRSVYLDDFNERNYYQKIAGICDRKKYRLRAYNHSPKYIALECKEKHNNWICKTNAVIDKETCHSIISGDYSVLENRNEQVLKEVYATYRGSGLKNSVIVDYHREAFVYPVSNLRITFDKHLHAGGINGFEMFTDGAHLGVSVPVYMNNSVILELKYDEYIPEFIRSIIPSNTGMPLSISKYCLCKNVLKSIQ